MDLAKLKTEITSDPLTRNYAVMSDVQIAESLNLRNRNTIDRETLSAGDLIASIVRSEWTALSAAEKQYVQLIAMAQTMPLTTTLKTELGNIFPAGSATRANLIALLKRTGSRAEEIGLGGSPTPSDVADAKRLP